MTPAGGPEPSVGSKRCSTRLEQGRLQLTYRDKSLSVAYGTLKHRRPERIGAQLTLSRRHRTHTDSHNDGVWGHVLCDAWRTHIDDIDAALRKLGDPLRDPLRTVTGAEFIDALWRIPPDRRGRFLADLKVPAARRPSAGIVESVGAAALARMSRWKDDRLHTAVAFVMSDTLSDPIHDLAHADANQSTVLDRAGECLEQLLADQIPPGLIVAGLVARLRDVAPGAALAAWLQRQPLPGTEDAGDHTAVARVLSSVLADLPWEAVSSGNATPPSQVASPADQSVAAANTAAAVDTARRAYQAAATLTAATLDRLQLLRAPDVDDLIRSLERVQQAHQDVAAAAADACRAAGLEAPADDADLTVLVAAVDAAADVTNPVRRATRRLRAIELDVELGACTPFLLEACHSADEGSPKAVELVQGLVRLAEAKAANATLIELTALDGQLRPFMPAELAPLQLGIMLGQVSLSAPDDTASLPTLHEPSPNRLDAARGNAVEHDDDADDVVESVSEELSHTTGLLDPSRVDEHLVAGGVDAEPPTTESIATQPDPAARDAVGVPPATTSHPDLPKPARAVVQESSPGDGVKAALANSDNGGAVKDETRSVIRAAVDARDTGLAYWLARAGGENTLAAVLRVATLAETLHDDIGPVADAAVGSLETLDPGALGPDRLAALAALAAALQTTIVTGSPDAGAVLELLGVHVDDHAALSAVVSAVARAAQRGALAGGQLRVLRSSDTGADELKDAQGAAAAELGRSRKVMLARATDMAAELFAPHGAVGWLLTAVVDDDRRAVDRVHEAVIELGDAGKLKQLIDELDRKARGGSGSARALQGKARQKLHDWIATALEPVQTWIRVARLMERDNWSRQLPGDLGVLKHTASSEMPAVRAELAELADGSGDDESGAVLLGAAVETVEQLLAGRSPVGSCDGFDVDEIIGRALLRAPRIPLDARLRPLRSDSVNVDALTEAARADWPTVIAARADAGDFATARHAIEVASTGDPAARTRYSAELDTRLATHRARSVERRAGLRSAIQKANRFGQLGDDDQARLSSALEGADPEAREDLDVVDAGLWDVAAELPELADVAAAEITEHLLRLVETQMVSVEQENRVRRRIDRGDLASAEEILAAIEAGHDLPDPVTPEVLEAFFPAVPDALQEGLTPEIVHAVRTGGKAAACDFGGLPEGIRSTNAAALDAWRGAELSIPRHQVGLTTLTAPLRLAGIEARGEARLPNLGSSADRRFVDLTGVSTVGNSIVPAFGSRLEGKLRLLLVWGRPTPQSIVNWVGQDKSDTPVLVCLFGVMSPGARRTLAQATAARPGKAVAVLDEATLLFLASRPEASITTTMQIVLPFSTTNPYVPQAEGNVPTEMFYGRNHELVHLTGHTDCLVYGGRQLGKSALLRAAQRRHEDNELGIAVYVSTQRPDTLWEALRTALKRRDIRGPRRESRDAYADVYAAIMAWLEANPGQRLLVLLDECDRFFDLDADDAFTQTTRLRDLRNQTDQRFKPVFAGLHEVARFASLPNQPFAHLGKPLPIGPLAPGEAYRLVTEPLATLGIRLEDDLAAWRVLAYCNNQPILLQLVCQHLVNHVHGQRDEFSPIPFVIADDELEQIWDSPTLVAEVSAKLRLTLDLDPRYGVVARVLGLAAHEERISSMSTVNLRQECAGLWPSGFEATNHDEFRALLTEMVTLGVLVQEGTNWALRSSNVRRMLGTSEDVESWLLRADEATVPGPKVAGETRQQLAGGRVAPLTEVQLAEVIGQRNQLRIVLGSRATGSDVVGDLLDSVHREVGGFELLRPRAKGTFVESLTDGRRGEMHRVVYSDVTAVSSESIMAEIEEAHNRLPGAGITRSVVLHLGIEQAAVWLDLLDPTRARLAADTVVSCRRLDQIGLEWWSHELSGQFSDPADRTTLLRITGGWPLLIDRVATECAAGTSASEALMIVRTELDGDLGTSLVEATKLRGSALEAGYSALVSIGAELLASESEFAFEQLLVDTGRPTAMLAALIAVGVVTRNQDGTLSLEPVLAALWQRHNS